ncbi:hypothetical protein AB5I41_09835 [Sphingomonas sp. MMS24-JH45]
MNEDKIRTLLAAAGMLMEDASARLILEKMELAVAITLLRDTAHDLSIIAQTLEAIERAG